MHIYKGRPACEISKSHGGSVTEALTGQTIPQRYAMKGIHVIAFLAFVTVIAADVIYPIPTKCPYPEKDNKTTTNLAHETDCTKFYKCNFGKGVPQDCGLQDKHTRLHYNRLEQVCDWTWRAGCAECRGKDRNGNYPRHKIPNGDDCETYWECRDGEKIPRKCPEGQCFSRTCQDCVEDREGGNCDDKPITKPPPCKDGDRKRHECRKNKYYECLNEEWVERYCKKGERFDPKTNECVWNNAYFLDFTN